MQIILVLQEWRDSQLKDAHLDNRADGLFSPGAYFYGTIFLEDEDEKEFKQALKDGFYPVAVIGRP